MAMNLCIRGTEGPAELALSRGVEAGGDRQEKDLGLVAPRISIRAWKAAPVSPRDALPPSPVLAWNQG